MYVCMYVCMYIYIYIYTHYIYIYIYSLHQIPNSMRAWAFSSADRCKP